MFHFQTEIILFAKSSSSLLDKLGLHKLFCVPPPPPLTLSLAQTVAMGERVVIRDWFDGFSEDSGGSVPGALGKDGQGELGG